jgi:Conserved mid region of cactin
LANFDEFYKDQQYLRSETRIRQKRETAIDYFVKIILIVKGKIPMERGFEQYMMNPLMLLDLFSLKDIDEALGIIPSIKQSNYVRDGPVYWECVETLMRDKLANEAMKHSLGERGMPKQPVYDDFRREINDMVSTKSLSELLELEASVTKTIKDPMFMIN